MIATYRLQLQPTFDFGAVQALLPYFQDLGISHLYLSPITEARTGSTHGYDVIDHNAVSKALGGPDALQELLRATDDAGLRVILDYVPNHAGVGPRNAYWQDVLAYGPHSPYANYFDIDWHPIKEELQGKILLPFLGRPYGDVLDDEELSIVYEDGRFFAAYYDNRFAIAPVTYASILAPMLERYERTSPYWDLKDLCDAYQTLEPAEPEKAEALRPRLHTLTERIDRDDLLEGLDGLRLHALLERQYWRLSYWKTAGYEINYRRFFDINGLVALRMEDSQVFWDAHRLLGKLLAQEAVTGVRIDHVDGLFDPHGYLERLRSLGASAIWVEKILAPGEILPDAWPVEGTTGYEFMNDAMGVLLQPEGALPLDRVYRRFVPDAPTFEDVAYASKKLIIATSLSNELFRLAYELDRISEADYHTRDYTLEALREALTEVVAAFDRYRTYLPYDTEEAQRVVQEAVYRARQRNPLAEPTVFDFIADVILGDVRQDLFPLQRSWVGRFQQYTAPVAAKGVEDTAFYRYYRLAALNEVGGEPGHFGQSVQAFHSRVRFRAHRYPRNLLATATHDHKRGEDTRMRLLALAEVPELWDETVHALSAIAAGHQGERGPSRADVYLFYQVLAALYHDADRTTLADRLAGYMQKAARERKQETSWLTPDEAYEEALQDFIAGMLEDPQTEEAIGPLSARLAQLGFSNTLSQVVLKFTTPGVPDIYQGCELLDLSLVDPDNRQAVDFERRKRLLASLQSLIENPAPDAVRDLLGSQDERAKFYVTARLLRVRRMHPELFEEGDYRALDVEGVGTEHHIAYARTTANQKLIGVVPRFPATWPDHREAAVQLPAEWTGLRWRELLTGAEVTDAAGDGLSTLDLPSPWAVLLTEAEA